MQSSYTDTNISVPRHICIQEAKIVKDALQSYARNLTASDCLIDDKSHDNQLTLHCSSDHILYSLNVIKPLFFTPLTSSFISDIQRKREAGAVTAAKEELRKKKNVEASSTIGLTVHALDEGASEVLHHIAKDKAKKYIRRLNK